MTLVIIVTIYENFYTTLMKKNVFNRQINTTMIITILEDNFHVPTPHWNPTLAYPRVM